MEKLFKEIMFFINDAAWIDENGEKVVEVDEIEMILKKCFDIESNE